jgi:hypothetical protein
MLESVVESISWNGAMKQNANKIVAGGSKVKSLTAALASLVSLGMVLLSGGTAIAATEVSTKVADKVANKVADKAKPALTALTAAATAPAPVATDLPTQILQRLARGQDASSLIRQYKSSHAPTASLSVPRGGELRQLQQAEAALMASLRKLQTPLAAEASVLQQGSSSFAQWRAAQMVLEVRQQAILKKLTDSHALSLIHI